MTHHPAPLSRAVRPMLVCPVCAEFTYTPHTHHPGRVGALIAAFLRWMGVE